MSKTGLSNLLAQNLTSDLFTYVSEGMGYWKLYEQPHREMCEALESHLPPPPAQMVQSATQKKFMMLAPRETLKTSVGAQGLIEYFLLKWKVHYGYDGRAALIRSSREDSYEVLTAISLDLSTQNTVLQRAFGNLSLMKDGTRSPTWKREAIILGWRDTVIKEPSILTGGAERTLTGKHVDLVVIDDIANQDNYNSPAKMNRAWGVIQSMDPVLSPWGSMIVIGTHWNETTPYVKILELNERERNRQLKDGVPEDKIVLPWDTFIRSVYRDDPGHEGELYYPDFLTHERIAQKKTGLEPKLFSAWYLNEIISDEQRVFQKQYLQFYDGEYTPDDDDIATLTLQTCSAPELVGMTLPVRATIHIDGATTVTEEANFTAYHLVLTDVDGRYWVHRSLKRKMVPSDTVSNIVADCREFVPRGLSIDVLGQQILWVNLLSSALRDAGLSVSIQEYKGKGKDGRQGRGILSKAKRIEALEPLFREGRIFFRQGSCNALVHEYTTYAGPTKSNHYDALDALSHILTMTSKPRPEQYQRDLEQLEDDEDDTPARRVAWAGR